MKRFLLIPFLAFTLLQPGGIAAPSANRYGRLSPTRAEHVREEFGEAVRVILDGGECQIGLESTIVSFEGEQVRLLRPGSVTAAQIRPPPTRGSPSPIWAGAKSTA